MFYGQDTNHKHLKTLLRTMWAPRSEQFAMVCNGQFFDLYSPPIIARTLKYRRLELA
jgi:hypothetical protein